MMMLPGIVTQIPTYILFHKYGLLNTFYPWLIWGIGCSIFLSTIGNVQPENAAVVIQQRAAAASILFMLPAILLHRLD
jgi:hypothetical protein